MSKTNVFRVYTLGKKKGGKMRTVDTSWVVLYCTGCGRPFRCMTKKKGEKSICGVLVSTECPGGIFVETKKEVRESKHVNTTKY